MRFDDGMMSLSMIMVRWYKKQPAEASASVVKFESIMSTMGWLHDYAVHFGLIKPLPSLPVERKRAFWDLVKDRDYKHKRKIRICQGLYALEEVSKLIPEEE